MSSLDYRGGLQNWSIKQGANGEIYVGNNYGLLIFDGYRWETITIPGEPIIRSIFVDGDRVYVGAYQEFGYFEKNEYGRMEYYSLWKEVRKYQSHNDEIWNIVKTAEGNILFQSFCSWFTYDGHSVKANYDGKIQPLYFFQVGNRIYAQLIDDGFYELQNGKFRKILERTDLNGDDVVSVMSLDGQRMMLCTEFHGLYILNDKRLQKFKTDVDSQLQKGQLNRAVVNPHDSLLVLGTILDGVYGIDMKGRVKWHYDSRNGLQNNTVLGLLCDWEGNVWVALNVGIALIHSGAPYALLNVSDNPLGMVYDVCEKNGQMYVATNQYTYIIQSGGIHAVEGTQGQNWHISHFGNQLIVGTNKGAKILSDERTANVPGSSEAGSTALRRYLQDAEHDYFIESSYYHLRIYRNVSGSWKFQHVVKGFGAPVSQFEIDNRGVIWAAHMNRGLFRIELSPDLKQVENLQYFGAPDGVGDKHISVMKIRGEIAVADNKKIYLISENGQFQPFDEINKLADGRILSSTPIDNNSFWLASDKGYTQIEYRSGRYQRVRYLPAAFFGMECGDHVNQTRIFNDYVYFCLNGGVGRMRKQERQTSDSHVKLMLTEVYYTDADNRRCPVKISGKEMAEVKGNITLRLSCPNYNNEPLRYRFRLKGNGVNLRSDSLRPEITFNNLKYGKYHFTAEVANELGSQPRTVSFDFFHPRPFYLSVPAFILYVLFMILIIHLLIRRNTNIKLEKIRQQVEKEKIEQELKMADQQRVIEEQQKKILEQQLQEKSREIATLTMDAVNMDNDGYWKIYRENFDLIHKNFFRTLRERYPSLTATDLKFCALLRLNLATKDIANFMGLTIRGVEGARYRIRKKLHLPEETSLPEFLIDLK